jgi:phage shock protein A
MYSVNRLECPPPLSQSILDRFETFKKDSVDTQVAYDDMTVKVEKAEKLLSAAEEDLAKNRWSSAKSKEALVKRLAKDLQEAKTSQEAMRMKSINLLAEYKNVIEIVSLQESIEASYNNRLNRDKN